MTKNQWWKHLKKCFTKVFLEDYQISFIIKPILLNLEPITFFVGLDFLRNAQEIVVFKDVNYWNLHN